MKLCERCWFLLLTLVSLSTLCCLSHNFHNVSLFFFQVNIHDLQKIFIAFHLSSYLYTGKYEIHKQTKECENSCNEYTDKLLLKTSLSKTLGTENGPSDLCQLMILTLTVSELWIMYNAKSLKHRHVLCFSNGIQ